MADDIQRIKWITVSGQHIPIGAGESKDEAIKKAFANKERQIAKNKEQADKLNTEKNRPKSSKNDKPEKKILTKKGAEDKVTSDAEKRKLHRDMQGDTPHKYKEVTEREFSNAVARAKLAQKDSKRWRVDVHDPNHYKEENAKCYTNQFGSTVAVTKSGDIVSVCKSGKDPTRGAGAKLLEQAVKNGGTKLDSFGGNHEFYTNNGFEPVSWTRFSVKYAPDGWDKSGCAQEPVVFYKYVGKGNVKYTGFGGLHKFISEHKPYEGDDGYDEAYAYRDSQIKKK